MVFKSIIKLIVLYLWNFLDSQLRLFIKVKYCEIIMHESNIFFNLSFKCFILISQTKLCDKHFKQEFNLFATYLLLLITLAKF